MIKIDTSHLLIPIPFLELKYKTILKKVLENFKNRYDNSGIGFIDVDVNNEVDKINEFVKENKDNYEHIIVLGIGGSALGTRAIFTAIKGKFYNELSKEKRKGYPTLHILDNIDPSEISQIIDLIDYSKTLFIVISKSGGTLETNAQYAFFKNQIINLGLDIKKHFIFVAGEKSNFKKNNLKAGFTVFDIPDNIGGRFSVFTNVGLLPLAFVGIDIKGLLKGVSNMKQESFDKSLYNNKALLISLIQYHSYLELGKNITVFFPYAANTVYLGDWYKQMIGESLGKSGIGVTLTSSIGVTDQHSQLQLYYDGPNDKLLMFLEVEDFGCDYNICCNKDFTFGNLMNLSKYGTQESISSYNKINYTIKIDSLKEETIGELIFMFEVQTAILGEFYGFDAFNQPGVEVGKKITKQKIFENIGKIEILEQVTKNIVFIGGGNGQSSLLRIFKDYTEKIEADNPIKYNISSIVSMSDDGRTTGVLMRLFKKYLDINLPPPGDLRRILFTLSDSHNKDFFSILFEKVINLDKNISEINIIDLFNITCQELIDEDNIVDIKKDIQDFVNKKGEIYNYFIDYFDEKILNFKIEIPETISGHKMGNVLMGILYYNFDRNYEAMILTLTQFLKINDNVLPITTDEATIRAILKNGKIIETQDKISNVADYDSAIEKIEILDNLEKPKIVNNIKGVIEKADYIIIGPGDLYTSIIANFVIEGLVEELQKTEAKIIYVLNANNKKGETTGYEIIDFIDVIKKNIGNKNINYILGNSKIPDLSDKQLEDFNHDISVKGGKYLIINEEERQKILAKYPEIDILSGEYIFPKDLYKYNSNLVADLVKICK